MFLCSKYFPNMHALTHSHLNIHSCSKSSRFSLCYYSLLTGHLSFTPYHLLSPIKGISWTSPQFSLSKLWLINVIRHKTWSMIRLTFSLFAVIIIFCWVFWNLFFQLFHLSVDCFRCEDKFSLHYYYSILSWKLFTNIISTNEATHSWIWKLNIEADLDVVFLFEL